MGEQQRKGQAGFTLIELVVVLVIIGILASLVAANAGQVVFTSQKTRIQAEMMMLDVAAKQYCYAQDGELADGVITQEVLVGAGFLPAVIDTPLASYSYVIAKVPGLGIQVVLVQGGQIYGRGEFEANTASEKFYK